ncbi:MAG: DUF6526 family protein [Ferruginibacter sp.]|nr:DUF6526 family protein [Ferruginibacter sp.]
MAQQNYRNHAKFYIPHHFIFYPIVTALAVYSIRKSFINPDRHFEWMALGIVFILLAWLSFMMRQHYALVLQNRLVRQEMRLRYFRLTGKALEDIEARLTFARIAALRFAPDEELPGLISETLEKDLSPKEIKKSIINWFPDHMRV